MCRCVAGRPVLFVVAIALLFPGITERPAVAARTVAPGDPLDLSGFLVELERVAAALEDDPHHPAALVPLRRALPEVWPVIFDGEHYDVPTDWLRTGLERIEERPESLSCVTRDLLLRTGFMAREARRLGTATMWRSSSEPREVLSDILAASEFRRADSSGFFDRMMERFSDWLQGLLDDLLGRVPVFTRAPADLTRTLGFGALVFTTILLFWVAIRVFRRPGPADPGLHVTGAPDPTWRVRLEEAVAAGQQGNHREAIRLAYAAALHRLQEMRVFRLDGTRTHREYLRLMPTGHDLRPVFEMMTFRFETTWYGKRRATELDVWETLAQLEALGCVTR